MSLGGQYDGLVTAHTGAVNGLAFSRDGRRLMTAGRDHCVRVWDVAAGARRVPVHFERAPNTCPTKVQLAVTPQGRELLAVPSGANVLLFDLATGRLVRTLKGHLRRVRACVAHPFRAGELYTGSNDPRMLAWTAHVRETAAIAAATATPAARAAAAGAAAAPGDPLDADSWD